MIANLLQYMSAKNYQNRERFDKDIAKINSAVFLPHMVDWKSQFSKGGGSLWSKISDRRGYPHQPYVHG